MIAIQNGRIFKDGLLTSGYTVLIADGFIQELTTAEIPSNYKIIDARNAVISPGFIDLQIYGSGGNLFSAYPSVATLRQMDNDLLSKGTTGFLACLATNTLAVFKEAIAAAKIYRKEAKGFLGLHLEGPFLNPKRRGAHVEEYIHRASLAEVKDLLDDAEGVVKMMTLAHELQDQEVIDYLRNQGIILSLGHSDATFEQANLAYASGFSTTTHLFNAMPAMHHRNPGLPVAALNHPTAMASIIADGIHVDPEMLKMTWKLMKDRLFLITDAVSECDRGPYRHRLEGDKFVTPEGTISGSNITLLDAVRNCVERCDVPLYEALRMATSIPARLIGRKETGDLFTAGDAANLLFLTDTWSLQKVFISGVEHLRSNN